MCQPSTLSQYLSGFNLVIHSILENMETKPDTLTRWWDIYLREGNSNYASVNPQNYHLVFTSEQLASSSELPPYQSQSSVDLSSWMLKGSIPTSVSTLEGSHFCRTPRQSVRPQVALNPDGLLCHLRHIYVLNSSNLLTTCSPVLTWHPLAGNFGQTKTLHQVHMQYYSSRLPVYVKDYCKSCTTCSRTKPVCHKPYGLLKQLLIPEKPWNSKSMDFIESSLHLPVTPWILVIVDWLSKQ